MLNKCQHPLPHQSTTARMGLCTIRFCSSLLPPVSPHLGLIVTISIRDPDSDLTLLSEKQRSCSTLLLSKARASICVLLKLKGYSLSCRPMPALPSCPHRHLPTLGGIYNGHHSELLSPSRTHVAVMPEPSAPRGAPLVTIPSFIKDF